MAANRSKRRKKFAIFLGPPLILFAAYGLWTVNGSRSVESDLAAIRKMGVATTSKELQELLPRHGQNAAPIYEKAIKKFRNLSPEEEKLKKEVYDGIVRASSPAEKQKAYLAERKLQHLLEPFREAAKMQRCVLPAMQVGTRDSDMAVTEDLQEIGEGCRMMLENVMCLSDTGHPLEAMDDVVSIEHIAGQLMSLPNYLAQLIGIGCEMKAFGSLRHVLRAHGTDPRVVLRAQEFVNSLPPPASLRNAYAGSFMIDLDGINELGKYHDARYRSDTPGYAERLSRTQPGIQHIRAKYVKAWRKVFELLPEDTADWSASTKAFNTADPLFSSDWVAQNAYQSGAHIFKEKEFSCHLWTDRIAVRRMATLCVNLADLKIKHGAFPSTLPDLGKNSIDPYSGRLFHYRLRGAGFLLYSVGQDRVDDNGKTGYVSSSSNRDVPFDLR